MVEVWRAAKGDLGIAATCLRAFLQDLDTDEADAGAMLLAEGIAAVTRGGARGL